MQIEKITWELGRDAHERSNIRLPIATFSRSAVNVHSVFPAYCLNLHYHAHRRFIGLHKFPRIKTKGKTKAIP